MRFQTFIFAMSFLVFFGTLAPAASAADLPVRRRVAIVVGSNAPPPGRAALRFAHDDAHEMSDVLTRVGHFAASDVHVLLDPTPAELLETIDDVAKSASGDALVLFYYSGHSDGQALYPHGESLAVTDVRDRLSRMAARVRVGVLDTCRGGSWTQAKGVTVGPALDPVDLLNVSTEGTALVSSSSGFEAAHEADDAHGSFFTHHFAAGLLGAADANGDGDVTLQEAYDYARERTVRDSARLAPTPQHPSFDLQLRGRQDIVLASLHESTSSIEIEQPAASSAPVAPSAESGPIEVIHLPSGITLAEVPPSSRAVRIAVPPARYLVRRVIDGRVYSKEVEVGAGETVSLAPGQLEATGTAALAVKGSPPDEHRAPLSLWTPSPSQHWLLNVNVGIGTQYWPLTNGGSNAGTGQYTNSFTAGASLWYRITDRLSWSVPFPAFAYRLGDPGSVEVMPYVGLKPDAWSASAGFHLTLAGDVDARVWTAPNQRITLGVGVSVPAYKDTLDPLALGLGMGNDVDPRVHAGYSWTVGHLVTLNAELGLVQDYYRGTLSTEWVEPKASIDVRVAPQASLNLGVLYGDEVYQHLGSYENLSLGTTIAF